MLLDFLRSAAGKGNLLLEEWSNSAVF